MYFATIDTSLNTMMLSFMMTLFGSTDIMYDGIILSPTNGYYVGYMRKA
jgi:hypothetical protein